MTPEPATSLSPIQVAQEMLSAEVGLELQPRDLALLVLLATEMKARSSPTLSLRVDEIRILSRRISALEGRDPAAGEKLMTESLNRLMRGEAIVTAGMSRLRNPEDAEYALTALGESITEWHVARARFSGEPLAAVLRAFNAQLVSVLDNARRCDGPEQWRREVVVPLQAVAAELITGVQRHQRALDREHERIRLFVPSMLQESSETSILECERVLEGVIQTVRDLFDVTLSTSTAAFGVLQSIGEASALAGIAEVIPVCQEIERRLESVVDWTTQRQQQWGAHYDVVHAFMRTVIRVDRSRKITEALKRAVAYVPTWTMCLASEPPMLQMRDLRTEQRSPKRALVRERSDHTDLAEEIAPEMLAQKLKQLADEAFAGGRARWTEIAVAAVADGGTTPDVVRRLPALMTYMIQLGKVSPAAPELLKVSPTLELQELEVRPR